MLSKNRISYINSLNQKKFRTQNQSFVAEGTKLVTDILASTFEIEFIAALPEWIEKNSTLFFNCELVAASEQEMKKITLFSTPSEVLAVVRIPKAKAFELNCDDLTLILDEVQNPGNLGTIVRLADWFGIKQVVCSPNCADIYNPKTVQATMGAVCRVEVIYENLPSVLKLATENKLAVYGTFLDGENIYTSNLNQKGLIVMGSEGNGISKPIEFLCTHKLKIPNFPMGSSTSESLNVSIAASIVCSEFRRKLF